MARPIAGDCDDVETCPKVWDQVNEGGDVFIRGYADIDQATLDALIVPPGERIIRVPREIILEAARRLTEGP